MGHDVVGIDNINDYYDVNLKYARLERIAHPLFKFIKLDIADRVAIPSCLPVSNLIALST